MKKYITKTIVILVMCLLAGCVTTTSQLTPGEQTYIAKAKAFPLEFTIPKSEADEAWGRAQCFIGKYSSMKLQIVTDFVIQTYNPINHDVKYGYYVTKAPMGDKVQITVQCNVGNMFFHDEAITNAHILAYYIKTGEIVPRLITSG